MVEEAMAGMRWTGRSNPAYLESRPAVIWFSTLLIARWLACGTNADADELGWIAERGRLAAQARVSVVNIVRANLAWRDTLRRVLQEEAARLGTPRDVLEDTLRAVNYNCDAGIVRTVGVFDEHVDDIGEQLDAERAALRHEALHDSLTGLPNRTLLYDRLEQARRSALRRHSNFAVLVIDLDGFKEVNDHLGHRMGDVVLNQVAACLVSVVRGSDTIARLGGDEFVAVLEGADRAAASVACRRMLRTLLHDVTVGTGAIPLGASIGISLYPEDGDDGGALLEAADQAMYRAKLDGGRPARWAGDAQAHP
jgi:diguanylate cyclase (GGDEF)-like protein